MEMTKPPAVSVMMPVYNTERYLAEAMESILGQTFRDFEFLIVDDGSTDGSRAIVERYASRDERIRLISRPNTGYVIALNEMLGMARADLLARMDSDDVARADRFAVQVEYLSTHPEIVCVGSAVEVIDPAGRFIYDGHPGREHEALVEECLTARCPLNHPSVMMRREAVLKVHGYRPEMMPAEDLDLWLRLSEVGRLANLDLPLMKYRYHPQSVSERHQERQLDRMRVAVLDACERRGIPPREIAQPSWRPTDRTSRADYCTQLGWIGFNRGDRGMALEYAARALVLAPWRPMAWRLLACTLLKRRATRSESPRETLS